MHRFLTVLFASPLCHKRRGQAAAALGQKSACGLRSHRSGVRPKNSNLIEKKVSIWTVNWSKCIGFSPFFLCRRSVIMNAVRLQQRRAKISLWTEISLITGSARKQQFNWKAGEYTNCKMVKTQLFLTVLSALLWICECSHRQRCGNAAAGFADACRDEDVAVVPLLASRCGMSVFEHPTGMNFPV